MEPLLLEKEVWQTIALAGLTPLSGERTPQSLYHVLTGRKSSQTVQDVHLFQLHPYYRLFPALSRSWWEETLHLAEQNGFVVIRKLPGTMSKPTMDVTEKGKDWLRSAWRKWEMDQWLEPLDGFSLSAALELFWLRLHLMVQTVSHLLHHSTRFFPIVMDRKAQRWVKETLSTQERRQQWLNGLFAELYDALSGLPVEMQRLLVEQFSGASQAGKTLEQIAAETGEPAALLRVKMVWALQTVYLFVQGEQGTRFSLLPALCSGSRVRVAALSKSAHETKRYLERGWGIEQIARKRNLKPNTVEDHLVEIALHTPDCRLFAPYLNETQKRYIQEASRRLQTKRLRTLKEHLGDEFTYLQIRLALALKGGAERDGRGT